MVSAADTAFILAAAGLVLLMTPGLALFLCRSGLFHGSER